MPPAGGTRPQGPGVQSVAPNLRQYPRRAATGASGAARIASIAHANWLKASRSPLPYVDQA